MPISVALVCSIREYVLRFPSERDSRRDLDLTRDSASVQQVPGGWQDWARTMHLAGLQPIVDPCHPSGTQLQVIGHGQA